MKIKEDLIGSKWKCSWPGCNHTQIITEDGIEHWGNNHAVINSLNDLLIIEKWKTKVL